MKNAEWVNKKGYNFNDLMAIKGSSAGKPYVTIFIKGRTIETFEPNGLHTNDGYRLVLAWLDMEHAEPPILDDVEYRYLKAVLEPFKKRVVFVRKDWHNGTDGKYEQIVIRVENTMPDSIIDIKFPFFKPGTMYNNMTIYKEYTMKELGL